MPDKTPSPFRADAYAVGVARDGRAIALLATTGASAVVLGAAVAAIGPWAHYGYTPTQIAGALEPADDRLARYEVRVGDASAGAVLIHTVWLAGPYLQMLAVLPEFQGLGVGDRLLAWYEAEAAIRSRNAWLCVSGFNVAAQRFYRRHGWEETARIDDLMRAGDDELLMRKRLARA